MEGQSKDYVPLYYLMSKTSIGVQTFVRQQLEDNSDDENTLREMLLGRWSVDFKTELLDTILVENKKYFVKYLELRPYVYGPIAL